MTSLLDITECMHKIEHLIQKLNQKYAYQVEQKGSIEDKADFLNLTQAWDKLKAARDKIQKRILTTNHTHETNQNLSV